jgi:hypothetical protein
MAELNARDAMGPPSALASGPVGPLQKALLDARAGREARVVREAADAKGAAAITSGMQASAAPRLDTSSFRRRLGGTAAAPTPATSTLTTPLSERGLPYRLGQGVNKVAKAIYRGGQSDAQIYESKRRLAEREATYNKELGELNVSARKKLKQLTTSLGRGISDFSAGISGR